MARLDETALRKPEFREGYGVKLADGQIWHFPKPRLLFRPARDGGGEIGLSGGWTHDAAYERLRDQLLEADPENAFALINLSVRIACYLLLANYDLADEDLGELLPFAFDDEANAEMWGDLRPIIYADPKGPSRPGSGPPSPPSG